jgi:hypothetical protein
MKTLIRILCVIVCVAVLVFVVQMLDTSDSEGIIWRAEVMEVLPPTIEDNRGGILVRRPVGLGASDSSRGFRYIIVQNSYVVTFDAQGEHMQFLDVPQGAIVDITFPGLILTRDPGIIEGATRIQIIEIPSD